MRPWQAIVIIILLTLLSASSGWRPIYWLAYTLFVLLVLSWVWARYSLSKLVFRRTPASARVQGGGVFDERLMLDNLSVMPKLWGHIAAGSTLPRHRARHRA